MITSGLAACAGVDYSSFPFRLIDDKPAPAETAMATSAPPAQPAPVAVDAVDPLNAPPPMADAPPMANAMLVPAPNAAQPADASQRVPLGVLAAPAPAGAPLSITQAPPAKPTATPQPTMPAPTLAPPPAPAQSAPTMAALATPVPAAVMPPAQVAVAPTPATPMPTASPAQNPAAAKAIPPALRAPVGRPSNFVTVDPRVRQDAEAQAAAAAERPPETVVISSATAVPAIQAMEFVPAAVLPGQIVPLPGLGDIPPSGADRNVVERFVALRRLQEESLITQEEYSRRRSANIGALLPYTRDPGSVGLERSVPGSDAIIARIAALRRSFEMRAISATQHALERTMILNALLPETPTERAMPKPPPADVLQGAAMVGRLEALKTRNLITEAEMAAEREAIEHAVRTGLLPSQEMAAAAKKPAAKPVAAQTKPAAAPAVADPLTAEITGPVLHLASFRTDTAALQAWQDAQTRNKATLGSLKPIIRRVDLGPERGIFFRLMAGTFGSMSEAEAVCIALKQNNQFCRASADGS